MDHPFTWLPAGYRLPLLAVLLVAGIAFSIRLGADAKVLRTGAAQQGGFSYQFAWTSGRAAEILGSWQGETRRVARRSLLVDFGFLLVYPLLLALACAMLADSPLNRMAAVGVFLAWLVLLAAPLDAVENLALLRMLDAGPSAPLARLAGWAAGLKWSLAFAAVGYLILQGIAVGAARLNGG